MSRRSPPKGVGRRPRHRPGFPDEPTLVWGGERRLEMPRRGGRCREWCDQPLLDISEPPAILPQTPLGTLSQASICASFLDVPAQEEVAVWQSFLPALATPKHFSVVSWAWTWLASSSAALRAAAMVRVVFMTGLLNSGGHPFRVSAPCRQ